MDAVLDQVARLDAFALEQTQALRWAPLTALFVLASAWWVKGLVFVGAGVVRDVRSRRLLPRAALSGAVALGLTSAIVWVVQELVDRARPPLADPDFQALVATPGSPSFPSGHAATAFAAAVAVGAVCPRLRWPLLGLAALVALSRVYLGVHYWLDVLAGAALGAAVGLGVAWILQRSIELAPRPARA